MSDVRQSGDSAVPPDGMVLSVANAAAKPLPELAVGNAVQLRTACEPDMTGVRVALSGGPMLLAGGKALMPDLTE